jgi:hypothetical protein
MLTVRRSKVRWAAALMPLLTASVLPAQQNRFFQALLPAVVALATACATEPPPRPVQLDPSNPAAAESPPLTAGALAQPSQPPTPGSPAPAGRTEAAPDAGGAGDQRPTLYTCPMHPEVISDKPGKCPKCGMTLVPREPIGGKP